ncbi:Transcriptional regulator of sugar metabolism [Gilliamella apicola SCGC AB-598-I20]|nr:Transcriptional regulator of sugar metabolism [Gilliamella apicola SCGC AB-598-I20]
MKLTVEERRNKIIHEILLQNEVKVQFLADKFGVTTETIRKDIAFLEKKNILSKKHGTAIIASPFLESQFSEKTQQSIDAKTKIAEQAIKFIPENASILLDTSTTVLPLAKLLIMRDDLTIITNSLIINEVLANSNNKLLLTGGEYRKKSNSYVGNWAIEAIKGLNVDIAFIGCDGLAFNGPTISSYKELDIKKSMINCSKKSIILCDSSKLDNQGLYTFSNYDNLDVIIMERNISKSERQKFPDSAFFLSS